MGLNQDFPISIEVQLLGGAPAPDRTTANVCTPGTEIFMKGAMVRGHCTNSRSAIYRGDAWVRVEVDVRGGERVTHRIDGQTVLEYEMLQIGGGAVNNFDPMVKKDGAPLTRGYIAIQGESHPTEFRTIEILNLSGCMNPQSPASRPSVVVSNCHCPDRSHRSAWRRGFEAGGSPRSIRAVCALQLRCS
jgi:hypothetical protein